MYAKTKHDGYVLKNILVMLLREIYAEDGIVVVLKKSSEAWVV
jgi:hypothetical protein